MDTTPPSTTIADANLKIINDELDIYYSPYLPDNALDDIDSKMMRFEISRGKKNKLSLIGNSRRDWTKSYNEVHKPLLNYYENIEWWQRDTQHDFDAYMKKSNKEKQQ